MNIKQRFKNRKIKQQIFISFTLLIFVVFVVFLLGIRGITNFIILNYAQKAVENNLLLVSHGIENSMDSTENASNLILIGLNTIDFLKEETLPDLFGIKEQNQVEKQLNYGTSSFKEVDYALFVDRFDQVYASDFRLKGLFESQNTEDLIAQVRQQSSQGVWLPMGFYACFSFQADLNSVAVLSKNIMDMNTGDYLGSLFLILKETEIFQNYQNLGMTAGSSYLMIDRQNKILSATDPTAVYQTYEFKGQKSNFLFDLGTYLGWGMEGSVQSQQEISDLQVTLIYNVPVEELLPDKSFILILVLLVAIIFLIIALYVSIKLSKLLSRPILQLCSTIKLFRKEHGVVETEDFSPNEINLLTHNFHSMVREIDQLILKVNQEEMAKRKHEFALIQSQIKPHFLYNTLDTAYVLAHLGEAEKAKTTIKALADFYRAALSSGAEEITLAKEIKNIRDYLKIQSIRYSDMMTVDIDISTSLLAFSILKLSIQPLVENAIYHGLKPKEDAGYIKIYSREQEATFQIIVEDNGVGMSLEQIENLLSPHPENSFGLQNVRNRLKLYYGETYDLQMKVTDVTQVIITLPKKYLH